MPVTEEDFKQAVDRLEAIANDINHLTHGNGRAGVHTLIDDVYGPAHRARAGLMARVGVLESQLQALVSQRSEARWLQRGVAVGMALVAADTVLGLNLAGLLRGILPQ